ncbi:NHLP-related RiPP peptide [Xanthomonas sacchari]
MKNKHVPLSYNTAYKLIELLSRDDDFRQFFQENPKRALEFAGVSREVSSAAVMAKCVLATDLASKEEFSASKEKILEYLTSKTAYHVVHSFDSGNLAKLSALEANATMMEWGQGSLDKPARSNDHNNILPNLR